VQIIGAGGDALAVFFGCDVDIVVSIVLLAD
jgi:hypothetical protein